MRLPVHLRAALAVGAAAVLAAGCTSSSADGPTSESLATPTVSASVVDPRTNSLASSSPAPSVIEPPSKTPSSSDLAPQEVADRAAVELAWRHFWDVSDNLWRVPAQDRPGVASAVAVDPTLNESVEQARILDEKGLEAYGSQIFHPYWEGLIDGRNIAIMGDCTDTSQSGAQEVASGVKKTVGVPERNTRATFVRGEDGYWRVQKIDYLVEQPCP